MTKRSYYEVKKKISAQETNNYINIDEWEKHPISLSSSSSSSSEKKQEKKIDVYNDFNQK